MFHSFWLTNFSILFAPVSGVSLKISSKSNEKLVNQDYATPFLSWIPFIQIKKSTVNVIISQRNSNGLLRVFNTIWRLNQNWLGWVLKRISYIHFILFAVLRSYIKFIYSEKATKIFEIFTLLLSYLVPVKSKVKISQNCVAFSEYINFNSTNEQQQSGKKRLCKSGFEILGRRWSYWTIIVKFLRITVIEKLSYFSGKFLLEFGRSVNPI